MVCLSWRMWSRRRSSSIIRVLVYRANVQAIFLTVFLADRNTRRPSFPDRPSRNGGLEFFIDKRRIPNEKKSHLSRHRNIARYRRGLSAAIRSDGSKANVGYSCHIND